MNGPSHALAHTLIDWCHKLLPADRAPWAAAMKAELSAIEDRDAALAFAIGCFWGSIKERILTMTFAARSLRIATIAGMLALSVQSALVAGRMIDAHAFTALVFGLISALFAAASVWSYLRGPMALVQTASSMIPVYIAFAFVLHEKGMASQSVKIRLYEALAVEGIVIWAALLIGGIFMLRVENLSLTKRR